MTDQIRNLLIPIQRYFEREFGDTLGFNWKDLHHVHLAYAEDENPPYKEMQVEVDLIEHKFRFFYDGKLVDEDTASDESEFITWLEFMSYDELISGCRKDE